MVLDHGKESAAEKLAKAESPIYDPSLCKRPFVYDAKRRYALLVVDMLNDFITGAIKCERMIPKISHVSHVVDAARQAGVPVIYSNDAHRRSDFELYRWLPHAMQGTWGGEVIKELTPKNGKDHLVPKRSYSSFYETDLDHILRGLYDEEGANTLLLAGLHADCCVRHTAADAFFRRYEVVVVEDAVESFTEAQLRIGIEYVRYWYLADAISSKEAARLVQGIRLVH